MNDLLAALLGFTVVILVGLLIALALFIWIVMILDAIRTRRWIWLIIILALDLLGAILYMLIVYKKSPIDEYLLKPFRKGYNQSKKK